MTTLELCRIVSPTQVTVCDQLDFKEEISSEEYSLHISMLKFYPLPLVLPKSTKMENIEGKHRE